ncbi:hypothetical protein AB205_0106750 [Aquarana catesbeiana]|uniref:Uncharacterized protein n=1 Tax=Aquarana catesbeiana TaxID=8400 RepID=A0A2G9RH64_AQUCT|nr:hypothetical protein AB205_0106750 [Aquarana catesbeiana]
MRETPPAPDILSSLFPTPSLSAQWESTWWRKSKCMQRRAATSKAWSHKRPDPGGDLRPQICPLSRWWRWWTS